MGGTARPDRGRPAAASSGGPAGRAPLTAAWLRRRYVVQRRSSEQMAAECGWSSQYVRDQLRVHGIPLRPPGAGSRSGEVLDRARLVQLIAGGASAAGIAEITGYSVTGVYKRLRREGLTPRPRPGAGPGEDAGVLDTIRRLYCGEERSLSQIGTVFGRGPAWVRSRLVAAGVPLRSPGRHHRSVDVNVDVGVDEIRRLLDEGGSVASTAVATGRPAATVRDVLLADGWSAPHRRRRQRLPPLEATLLRRMYLDQRRTISEIAADQHCSADRVRTSLIAAGIPRRTPGGRDDQRPVPIPAERLREMYVDQQLTVAEIALVLHCSTSRVRAAIDRHGLPRRPRYRRLPPLDLDQAALSALYVDERLDDRAIGGRLGVPAWRVTRRRRELNVARPASPPPHPSPPRTPAAGELRRRYVDEGLTLAAIARSHHTSRSVVRRWLLDAGIAVAPRTNRSHRRQLDPTLLRELYEVRQWTAAEIAADQDSSIHLVLRSLHDNAIAVRRGGARGRDDGRPHRLLTALYSDPEITAMLRRHRIPRRTTPGPIATRFPTPKPLSEALLRQAYLGIGLSARQIELLTGQPAEQILNLLHAAGIDVRTHDAAASPWWTRQLR